MRGRDEGHTSTSIQPRQLTFSSAASQLNALLRNRVPEAQIETKTKEKRND
jgi:hypothetical protein